MKWSFTLRPAAHAQAGCSAPCKVCHTTLSLKSRWHWSPSDWKLLMAIRMMLVANGVSQGYEELHSRWRPVLTRLQVELQRAGPHHERALFVDDDPRPGTLEEDDELARLGHLRHRLAY